MSSPIGHRFLSRGTVASLCVVICHALLFHTWIWNTSFSVAAIMFGPRTCCKVSFFKINRLISTFNPQRILIQDRSFLTVLLINHQIYTCRVPRRPTGLTLPLPTLRIIRRFCVIDQSQSSTRHLRIRNPKPVHPATSHQQKHPFSSTSVHRHTMSSKLIPVHPSDVMVTRDVTPNIATFSVPFSRFGRIKIGGRGTLG